MKRRKCFGLVVACLAILLCTGAFADTIDLSLGGYNHDIPAGTSDVIIVSFDYNTGGNDTTVNFRRLKDDGGDGWMMPVDVTSSYIEVDTDYGPYRCDIALSGINSYVFSLNSYNGLWTLAVNGSALDFVATSSTTTPQPDGTAVTIGAVITDKYFSDETPEAMQNAVDLGWTANAGDGVGSAGAYRIKFEQASNSSVSNITVVPEPATLALLSLGGLALIRRKRS